MSLIQILRGRLIPTVHAAEVKDAKKDPKKDSKKDPKGEVQEVKHSMGPNCRKMTGVEVKPSSLSLYSNPCLICTEAPPEDPPLTDLEQRVSKLRKDLWLLGDGILQYRHTIYDFFGSTVAGSSNGAVAYLRDEGNGPQRYGAVGIGALAGMILGLRGGTIRRMFYAGCGAAGMAAVCYPNEAADYLDDALSEGKKYFVVAYHFVNGDPESGAPELRETSAWKRFPNPKTLGRQYARIRDMQGKECCNCEPINGANPRPCLLHSVLKPSLENVDNVMTEERIEESVSMENEDGATPEFVNEKE